jgi:hypothetical protein
MTVPTAPFRRAAASGLYYVFLEAAVAPSIGQRVTPSGGRQGYADHGETAV